MLEEEEEEEEELRVCERAGGAGCWSGRSSGESVCVSWLAKASEAAWLPLPCRSPHPLTEAPRPCSRDT